MIHAYVHVNMEETHREKTRPKDKIIKDARQFINAGPSVLNRGAQLHQRPYIRETMHSALNL